MPLGWDVEGHLVWECMFCCYEIPLEDSKNVPITTTQLKAKIAKHYSEDDAEGAEFLGVDEEYVKKEAMFAVRLRKKNMA